MIRRTVAAAAAALAALASVGACTSTDATGNTAGATPTQSSDATTSTQPDQPKDLSQIPEGTALQAGMYSVPFLAVQSPERAIVDVPDGFVSAFNGSVIGSDDGDMAFWGKVTQVDTDPCGRGKHISAGTSVQDLADALVAQRHMKTTQPVPVTVGGYHGVYLKTTAPAHIDRCRGGTVTIYTADGGTWLQLDVPSATFREWILNVHGQRVVGGTRSGPDATDSAELAGMVESAEFTDVGQP